MVYLFLSVSCSLAVAAIFKYNETRDWDRTALLTANYWTATVVAALALWGGAAEPWTVSVLRASFVFLTLVTGGLFIGTYFVLAWATDVAGMGLATGVMRVSVVLPVAASWLLWNEQPSRAQSVGLLLAVAAFFCIASRRDSLKASAVGTEPARHPLVVFLVLLLLFLSGGVVDTCMKLFDEAFASRYPDTFFLTAVYAVAASIGTSIMCWKVYRRRYTAGPDVLAWGLLLGLFNYGATLFFLRAVARLAAPFVFPANSISIVLGAALIGVYVWNENLSRTNWLGLGLAAAALVLLRV